MGTERTTFKTEGGKVIAKRGCKTISMSITEADSTLKQLTKTINQAKKWEPGIWDLLQTMKCNMQVMFQRQKYSGKKSKETMAVKWFIGMQKEIQNLSELLQKIESFFDNEKKMKPIIKNLIAEEKERELAIKNSWIRYIAEAKLLNSFLKTRTNNFTPIDIPAIKDRHGNRQLEDLEDQIADRVEDNYEIISKFTRHNHEVKSNYEISKKLASILDSFD